MIVRIMGEGQFDVPDSLVDRLNELDNAVLAALDSGDETEFRTSLDALLAAVRAGGKAVPADYLGPSDATLPFESATVDEVKALLHEDGLIPG
ncbi:PspA-associated protein PspAA [Streptacidiphilus monticola]|uniref:PspA-associated domain-containing protein n=1 Tax=Streptacidiphilus monticola TaxID=2161674 RepID=A0ABW1FVB5_9ACTN